MTDLFFLVGDRVVVVAMSRNAPHRRSRGLQQAFRVWPATTWWR